MESRVFNRKNLLGFSMIVLFYHLAMTLIPWFVYSWPMFIADYILLGIMASGWLLYWGWNRIFAKPKPAMIILIGFLIWLFISCIAMTIKWNNDWVSYNFIPTMSSPTAPGFNAAVTTLFMFPLGVTLIREKDKTIQKLGKTLLHILLLGWTVWIAIVLIVVMQGKTITTPSGGVIGMVDSKLELNCHWNITGSWEMTFFIVSCFMVLWCKGLLWKGIYGVSAIIHYFALVLSNSRASIFAALGGMAILAGVVVLLKLKTKKTSFRVLWVVLTAIIAGIVFYFLRYAVFSLYGATIHSFNAVGSDTATTVNTAIADSSAAIADEGYTIREFTSSYGSFHLSGREDVWKYTIQGIFSGPFTAIFGVTPKSTGDMIAQASNGAIVVSYTHNQFLEIAAAMGIPGLLLFLIWLISIIRDTWKMYFIRKEQNLLLCVPIVFATLLAANMMEAHLVFCEHLNGYVFFLLGGMIYGAIDGSRKELIKLCILENHA